MIPVVFDDQIFRVQRRGGISRYFGELVAAYQRDPRLGVAPIVTVPWTANEHAVELGVGQRPVAWSPAWHERAWRAVRRQRRQPPIRHATFYMPQDLRLRRRSPLVVTVHDMIPELLPELFPHGNPHFAKQEYVAAAAAVICVSESTRRDLVAMTPGLEVEPVVVPLGVSPVFQPGATRPAGLPDRYLLFVGRRDGYKDFGVALEAFAELQPSVPGLHLVAAGDAPFTDEEQARIDRLGLGGTVHHIEVSDRVLPGVYAGAYAFVFASRYEGFGLPTLEAMASGVPVIVAATSSHLEVGGDAALFFEPGDPSSLHARLAALVGDPALRDAIAARGLAHVARFTWQETARRTADVYRAVATRRSAG